MESAKPMVSVVMITYGHDQFIARAIQGVFEQRLKFPIQFIISDDCSPDHTEEVVNHLLKSTDNPHNVEVQYTKHPANLGMLKNFEWALHQATGDYIALCEGDDYWIDPLKLQKQVDFLENHPDYLIHSAKAQVLRRGRLEEIIGDPLGKDTYNIRDFYTHNNFITCTVMFRNNIADFESLNQKELIFGDWFLYTVVLATSKEAKGYVDADILSVYRDHPGGITKTIKNRFDMYMRHFNQVIRIRRLCKPKYTDEDILRINIYAEFIAQQYLGRNQFAKFVKTLFQNYSLCGNKMRLRKYLFTLRYRKQIDLTQGA